MPTYLEAINTDNFILTGNRRTIFLAGGITGCVDWQKVSKDALMASNKYKIICNPRRADFDVTDPTASEKQIKWEADHLKICTDILFWFSSETIQPIALFELGKYLNEKDNIFVGCDPDYSRKFDVITQVGIYRPDIKVWDNLDDMMEHIVSS